MKHSNNGEWDDLYPITLSDNVFDTNGESIETKKANQTDLDATNDELENTNQKVNKKIDKVLIPFLNVKDFGAVGGATDDTQAVQDTIDSAVSNGIGEVVIPYSEITIGTINAKQRIIRGYNTTIHSGTIKNVKKIESCIINNIDYDYDTESNAPISVGISPKAIERIDTDKYHVISKLPYGKKYVMFLLERNITTDTNSVGGVGELLRPTFVYNINKAYVYAHERSGYSGTWEEWLKTYNSTDSTYRAIKFWRNTSQGDTDHIQFSVPVDESEEFTLLFYSTAGSDPNAIITIDGEQVGTVDLTSNPNDFIIETFKAKQGTRVVRITASGTGTNYIYVAGYNYYSLDKTPKGKYVDSVAFTGGGNPYISNKGAMEYAFYDLDESIYYGSYHGDERLLSEQIQLDGQNSSIAVGHVVVRDSFVIKQQTNIHDKFTSNTIYEISGDGLLELTVNLEGNARLGTLYNCMTTTDNGFTNVLYPKYLFTEEDGETYLGRTNKVIQENPNTAQKITTFLKLHKHDNNIKGGVFIRRTTGAYNKIYYGKVVQSEEIIKELSYQTKWLFH